MRQPGWPRWARGGHLELRRPDLDKPIPATSTSLLVHIASLVFGITGLVLALIPSFSYTQMVGGALSLAALVLGIIAVRKALREGLSVGMATTGLVLGIVGVLLNATIFATCTYCNYQCGKAWDEASREMEKSARHRPLDDSGPGTGATPRLVELDGGEVTSLPRPSERGPGIWVCTKIGEGTCLDPANRFTPEAELLHVVCVSPRRGRSYRITWFAAEGKRKLSTTTGRLSSPVREAGHSTISGSLPRPASGWQPGRYRVEVRLDRTLVGTARFRIEPADR